MQKQKYLIIPIENQVRELDSKLLLACVAAQSGFKSFIGSRAEIDLRITSIPTGLYLSKSFTERSVKMFSILTKLGHKILAWDEEALVHYPDDIYYTRRMSANAIKFVSTLFAWGTENESLFLRYPHLPSSISIHITGNPRLDLLRTELAQYFSDDVEKIKQKHGDFILINTNFGNVNAFVPELNLFKSCDDNGKFHEVGRGSTGMTREYAEGRAKHKTIIMHAFLSAIPAIHDSIPNRKIIIRPHPVEKIEPYLELAKQYPRVEVINDGNVIPWLRSCCLLIHNGCTTGLEAILLNTPSIAYQPVKNSRYDDELPNAVSLQCNDLDELNATIRRVIDKNAQQHALTNYADDLLLHQYVSVEGALASERIVNVLKMSCNSPNQHVGPSKYQMLEGWLAATIRKMSKKLKAQNPASKYHPSFQRHRFPVIDQASLQTKADILCKLLKYKNNVEVGKFSDHIFIVK